jgi:hypothetical protein
MLNLVVCKVTSRLWKVNWADAESYLVTSDLWSACKNYIRSCPVADRSGHVVADTDAKFGWLCKLALSSRRPLTSPLHPTPSRPLCFSSFFTPSHQSCGHSKKWPALCSVFRQMFKFAVVQLATLVQELMPFNMLPPSSGQKMNATGFYETSIYT